jgi:hypothetical protein|tara:strand:+ start:1199 stop:1426 length:228 start_codon:yes stop_codon:yes gene_type:complete
MPAGKGYSSKSAEDKIKKAMKEGKITKKQFDALPEALLLGIAKKGDKKGGIKEKRKKASGKVGRPKAGSKVKVVE